MKLMHCILAVALVVGLSACGGGGGNAGSTGGTGSTGTTGGTGTTPAAASTLTIAVYNAAGIAVNAVSYGEAYEARAVLRDASGAAVVGQLVSFDMGGFTNATVSPASLVTNASGIAIVTIAPSSITAVGGATVIASAQVGGVTVSNQTSFNVAATSVTLDPIIVGTADLPSAGNTSVSVAVKLSGTAATGVPINVTYTASCGRINGLSGSVSVVTNGSGVASASYEAVNSDGSLCSGSVTLTASSASATSVTRSVTVAAALANAITYVSPSSAVQIFVAGSGALEQYVAQFKVLSGTSTLANQSVTFSLLVNPGGVGLGGSGLTSDVVATTDAAGVAKVTIFSGTLPGPVKVKAALTSDPSVFAETQNITVASGPASQKFMSLSVEKFNIEGWNIDGTPTKLTVRVADRQGNAVQDGTVINFTSEGGQVAHSCSTVQVNRISLCSVDFVSQNPRPVGGRISVLAYLDGTKDYIDVNANNRYDAGVDTLIQVGDAYRDDNENGTYDSAAGEFTIPRSGVLSCSGAGWPFPSRVNTCDDSLGTTVRQQAVILYTSSNPLLTLTSAITPQSLSFTLNSLHNQLLPMPAGTTVTAQASGQSVVLGQTVNCSVDKIFGAVVANISPTNNPLDNLGTAHTVTLKDCAAGANNSLAVTVTVPSGLATTFSYTIP